MPSSLGKRSAFSLVEVAIALGVLSFALLSVLALLPVGLKTNQTSSEELRAALLLSMLEADLRNTHPLAKAGSTSLLFGLKLPYMMNAANTAVIVNPALALNTLTSTYSTGVTETETMKAYTSTPPPRYQATVFYTHLPATPGAPVQARLIVNWPALNTSDPTKLTSLTSVSGYVETSVTFAAP